LHKILEICAPCDKGIVRFDSYVPGQAAYPAPGVFYVLLYLKILFAFAFAGALIACPAQALEGAQAGLRLWMEAVAPALLPFAVVMPYLTCAEARRMYDRLLGRVVNLLFALPGSAASAMMTGFVAGSPAGAMAVARVATSECMSRGDAVRLAGICCGVSPVYALTVMGMTLAGSRRTGWCFVISQLLAQIVTGLIFRNAFKEMKEPVNGVKKHASGRAMSDAVFAVLRVGGYMTIFSAGICLAATLAGDWVLEFAPAIDLPSGVARVIGKGEPGWKAAAALGFSGMCIISQNIGVLRQLGISVRAFIIQKLVCGIVCSGVYVLIDNGDVSKTVMTTVEKVPVFEVSLVFFVCLVLPIAIHFFRKTSEKHFS